MPPRTISVKAALGNKFAETTPFHSPQFRDKKEADAAPKRDKERPKLQMLTLPVPPTVNHLFVHVKGKQLKSEEGKAYAQTVAGIALLARCQPFEGTVGVRLKVFRPRKAGDLDNYNKALFDSLTGIFWIDDSQIIYIEAHRADDKENPRVEIEVWEVEL